MEQARVFAPSELGFCGDLQPRCQWWQQPTAPTPLSPRCDGLADWIGRYSLRRQMQRCAFHAEPFHRTQYPYIPSTLP